MIKKPPSNLVLHRNIYHFRKVVPADLRTRLGRSEIRLSLHTGYLKEARLLATVLTSRINSLFKQIRTQAGYWAMISDQQLQNLVAQWLHEELARGEEQRVASSVPITQGQLASDLEGLDESTESAREDLRLQNYSRVQATASDVLKQAGLEVDESSVEFRKVCRELLKAHIAWAETERKHLLGDYSLPSQQQPPVSSFMPSSAPVSMVRLSEVLDEYIEEKVSNKEWDEKTADNDTTKLRLFVDILGNPLARSLSLDHTKLYKKSLTNFPKNQNKLPRYRSKSVKEIMSMDIPAEDRLGATTLGNHFTKVKSFIVWAKANTYIPTVDINLPLTVKQQKNVWEYTDIFTQDELSRLFDMERYLRPRQNYPWKFWVPLMALFTGARIEEICQLHLSDIVEEDGTWCIWINDLEEKTVKNRASVRYVPLHPFLLDEMNFLAFVEQLRKSKAKRLFPKLTKKDAKDRYSRSVSRWFTTHAKQCSVHHGTKGKKIFHSFRDCVTHWCETNNVPEKQAARLVGHTWKNITYGRYSRDTAPSVLLRDVVSKIDYGIDFSYLKESKYVPKEPQRP